MMNAEEKEILESLEPLFKKAEREGLWFYSRSMDDWYSPKELREQNTQGKLMWGPINWQLRNPNERLKELENYVKSFNMAIKSFKKRIAES